MHEVLRYPHRVQGRSSGELLYRMHGASSIKVLVLIPVVLVLLVTLVFAFYEGRKAYWDFRVERMCKEDGGVKIESTIEVNSTTYDSFKNEFGQIDIPRKGSTRSRGAIAVYTYEDTYIRRHNPEVRKSKFTVISTEDKALLATNTTYSRVGGDLVALHPSYVSCPDMPENFFASVIVLRKE